jgi:hypothetical protein
MDLPCFGNDTVLTVSVMPQYLDDESVEQQ